MRPWKTAGECLKSILNTIKTTVVNGGKVQLSGFGSFERFGPG